ncbi:MAG: Gfo/Idh/MocA family protein [Anaerolineae bacterium]|nr:Gfo/Idh/MocA family oxidoreductase [Chloroflexota bacterium]
MKYNYEYDRKLQVGYIGAGEHSFRNILPAMQYAPIELVALTDHNTARGLAVARQFGFKRFYPNHKALIGKESGLDAVLIAVGPDEEGRPRYPELAAEALTAGFHVWVDAPPCLTASEISTYTNACIKRRKYLAVGFVRRFAPGYQRAIEIMADKTFGPLATYSYTIPIALPDLAHRRSDKGMAAFLPATEALALLADLFGEIRAFSIARAASGAAVLSLMHEGDLPGVLHLTAGQAGSAPAERLQITGRRATLVVEDRNNVTYYRRTAAPSPELAGRQASALMEGTDTAPLVWRPRLDLQEPATQAVALSGYLGSLTAFAERLLANEPPRHGTLVEALHVMTVFDRIRQAKDMEWTRVQG